MPNAIIDGQECSLFIDYDCLSGAMSKLSPEGKIEWLEKRMNMIFLDPMRKMIDRNGVVFKELEHPAGGSPMTAMLMATSQIVNGIEALGGFLTRSHDNNQRFYAFADKYLTNWQEEITTTSFNQEKLTKIIWRCYRNGLAHSFVIKNAGIEHDADGKTHHLNGGILQINTWKLFEDVQIGIVQMFQFVRTDVNAKTIFLNEFDDVYSC